MRFNLNIVISNESMINLRSYNEAELKSLFLILRGVQYVTEI